MEHVVQFGINVDDNCIDRLLSKKLQNKFVIS